MGLSKKEIDLGQAVFYLVSELYREFACAEPDSGYQREISHELLDVLEAAGINPDDPEFEHLMVVKLAPERKLKVTVIIDVEEMDIERPFRK